VIKNIQALRAAAAFLVVCAHLVELFTTLKVPPFGTAGVDLFFVISGFVMVYTTRTHPPKSGEFLKNRIARIVPTYWLLTLLIFLIGFFARSWLKATTADPVQLVKSLLFVPFAKSNGLIQPILNLGWSLNYEMFFYALFSIGLLSKNYIRGLSGVVAALILLVLVGLAFDPNGVIPKFYTQPLVMEFAFGMGVALLPRNVSLRTPSQRWFLVTISALSFAMIVLSTVFWPGTYRLFTAGIPSALLVMSVVMLERSDWRIRSPAVMAVGEASYVLYLTHPFVVLPIERLSLKLHPTGFLSLALIAVSVSLAIAVAVLLHSYIERPLLKWARYRLLWRDIRSVAPG